MYLNSVSGIKLLISLYYIAGRYIFRDDVVKPYISSDDIWASSTMDGTSLEAVIDPNNVINYGDISTGKFYWLLSRGGKWLKSDENRPISLLHVECEMNSLSEFFIDYEDYHLGNPKTENKTPNSSGPSCRIITLLFTLFLVCPHGINSQIKHTPWPKSSQYWNPYRAFLTFENISHTTTQNIVNC